MENKEDFKKFMDIIMAENERKEDLKEFSEATKKELIKIETHKRPEIILALKIDRFNLLMQQQTRYTKNDTGFDVQYEKDINLALKISELIKLMVEETIREAGG